jgi:hypothetical protein
MKEVIIGGHRGLKNTACDKHPDEARQPRAPEDPVPRRCPSVYAYIKFNFTGDLDLACDKDIKERAKTLESIRV